MNTFALDPTRSRRRLDPVGRLVASALFVLSLGSAGLAPATAETLEIRAANREYSQLNAPIVPIQQGPFTIRLASPAHALVVHANRLDFQKLGSGALAARFEVDLEGFGDLVAEIQGPNDTNTRLEDRVSAPRQKVRAAAEVRLLKAPDGYFLTLLKPLDPNIELVIVSGIAEKVVSTCRVFEVIPALSLFGCDVLQRALSTVKVPMPKVGTHWKIAASQLTPAERAFFDRYASPL